MSLPYPLPDGWAVRAAPLRRRWPAYFWGAVAVGLGVGMVLALLRGDVVAGLVLAAAVGIVGAGLGVAYERVGSERGTSRLINAVVLTEAVERPQDSWIHFFREKPTSRWLMTWFASAGWVASLGLVGAGILAVIQGSAGWLFLIAPLFLGAAVLALAGTIAVYHIVRHSSFGRRPIGISLGRHGVVRYYLDGEDVWPWESITGVVATTQVFDESQKDFSATLVLRSAELPPGVTSRDYVLDGCEAHPWLIFTAVRFWHEHPELRSELSTTYAQRRIEGWRDAMLSSAGR